MLVFIESAQAIQGLLLKDFMEYHVGNDIS